MKSQKIIEAIQGAVNGDFGRVTVAGQTWMRVDDIVPNFMPGMSMEHRGLYVDGNSRAWWVDPQKSEINLAKIG